MDYEPQAYLRDTEDENGISGIAVLEVSDDAGYRVSENREDGWCLPFWMPESELLSHETEYAGQLSSDQYLRLCQKLGLEQ